MREGEREDRLGRRRDRRRTKNKSLSSFPHLAASAERRTLRGSHGVERGCVWTQTEKKERGEREVSATLERERNEERRILCLPASTSETLDLDLDLETTCSTSTSLFFPPSSRASFLLLLSSIYTLFCFSQTEQISHSLSRALSLSWRTHYFFYFSLL